MLTAVQVAAVTSAGTLSTGGVVSTTLITTVSVVISPPCCTASVTTCVPNEKLPVATACVACCSVTPGEAQPYVTGAPERLAPLPVNVTAALRPAVHSKVWSGPASAVTQDPTRPS